jgi:hypothetical protein
MLNFTFSSVRRHNMLVFVLFCWAYTYTGLPIRTYTALTTTNSIKWAGHFSGDVAGCPAHFNFSSHPTSDYRIITPEGVITGRLVLLNVQAGTNVLYLWSDDDGIGSMRLLFAPDYSNFSGLFGNDAASMDGCVSGSRVAAEEALQLAEDVKVPHDQDLLEAAMVIIKGRFGRGTGFFAKQKGDSNIWLYSNLHVLLGQTDVRLLGQDGSVYTPLRLAATNTDVKSSAVLEACVDRDLVRLRVEQTPRHYLTIGPVPQSGDVTAHGYPHGQAVLRAVQGKIIATGPATIEVDCPFVEGNSGGPIIHDQGVIGVATYLTKPNVNWVYRPRLLGHGFGLCCR